MPRGINMKPARVHQTVTNMLKARTIIEPPCWYGVIGQIPPGEFITRTQPVQHHIANPRKRSNKIRKPSKLFMPQTIEYEEDQLRSEFFQDHPWELARPRIVLEHDGKDGQGEDWSHIEQRKRQLSGESVIQRQKWLIHNVPGISRAEAYDTARKEFYVLRQEEEIERRVQKEEALWMGAYFGKGPLEWGMAVEDKMYESWKKTATIDVMEENMRIQVGLDMEAAAAEHETDPS